MTRFSVARLATTVLALGAAVNASLQIIPGATWTDTNTGKHVQAHGAGIIKVAETFYMIGEDKTEGSAFHNINCYSSTNLVEWSYVGALLTRGESGDLGPNRVVERPKVVYNKSTGQYVLYLHIDSSDYGDAKVGVATGSEVCGQYSYQGSFRPLEHQSRDMGLFVDDDETGYLLSEDRENGLRIMQLSPDYLTVQSETYMWEENIESPAILKRDGVYYMFGSKLTGWDPNDNVYSTATSLSGPWSSWQTFADEGSNTYASQTTFILPLGNTAIYMGDRWHSDNLMRSTYIWLPLEISATTVRMANRVNWILEDVNTGAWSPGPEENQYEGEDATLGNDARVISCSACSGGEAAGYIGGGAGGTVLFADVRSDVDTRTTIRVKYLNGDSGERYSGVRVNGGEVQRMAFLPRSGDPGSSTLHVDLRAGANEIVVEGLDGGWGGDLDRLMVPVS
ncbi:hypothetical protein AJ79_08351 [Helicocarpus griseus UAMH5409]|uniref:CBM6 domain-containing protein n=1 Tax=Helicocarpus griseus UAMH5409 TaxID=1447875 RepID=A0A2B7WTR9_9EURO|nr:hypothetical protein AJ79_08351 [Helicocarpus griseus UAMH5409]